MLPIAHPAQCLVYQRRLGVAMTAVSLMDRISTTWLDEGPEVTVAAGAAYALVPATFLKYVRLACRSTTAGQPTTLDITVQSQFL